MTYEFFHKPLAEVLYAALTDDAFYVTMEASVEGEQTDRREAMLRYLDYSMKEAHAHGAL